MTNINIDKKNNFNPYWNIKVSFILIFLTIFTVISMISVLGLTDNLDNSISDFFKTFRNQSLDLVMIIVTTTADTINLIIVGFILTVIKKTRRMGMILLISVISITILVTYVKPLFGISPPQYDFVPLINLPEKFTLEKDSFMPFAQNFSYPSNHLASAAAFSFIISGFIFNRLPIVSKTFIILFPAIIGFTKLYLFQHNLSDIFGGYFFGLLVVSIVLKILKVDPTESRENTPQLQNKDNRI